MGCNCAGSAPRSQREAPKAQQQQAAVAPKRAGGPGEPGYAWNGPPRPPKPKS